jgi:hypothetical protein
LARILNSSSRWITSTSRRQTTSRSSFSACFVGSRCPSRDSGNRWEREQPGCYANSQIMARTGFTPPRKQRMVMRSVVFGELKFWPRNWPVNQLTHEAESERSRLFALKAGFPKGCGDPRREMRVSVPNGLLSGSGSNHGGWARTPGATLSNSLTLSLTSVVP